VSTRPIEIRRRAAGFSLLEALIATLILTVAVGTVAQLFVVATAANRGARVTTMAAMFASEKLEELRSVEWGAPGLDASPAGALAQNTPGDCDFLDGRGHLVDPGASDPGATVPPENAVFTRRWAIAPLPSDPTGAVVLQVLVTTLRDRGRADLTPDVMRLPDEARFVTVKTRKGN
jgi:type II secretory pathway pseudopilin PulG